MIGIIDIGMGNLRSVRNAVAHLEGEVMLVTSPEEAERADRLILPGVGAFGAGMRRLEERGLVDALPGLVGDGRPILGICLGMQLLADRSAEHGEHRGLGLIAGDVEFLEAPDGLRIPHVGWNSLSLQGSTPLLAGLAEEPSFYFVHSFEFTPADPAHVIATTDYGRPVVAAVGAGRVMGTQFHPEKSQADGLRVLTNFLELEPC